MRLLREGNDNHDGYAAAGRYSVGWIDGRLIFSSDMSDDDCPQAQAQVWSVDGQGHDLRQHTHHGEAEGYVRDPRTDGTTIVYHTHGALWRMTGLDAEPERLEIDLGIGAPPRMPLDPTDRLEAIVSDHGGDGSLLEWRGAAYFLTHRSGPARALSAADGVRIREPRVLGQTGQGVWASDVDGEDCLEVANLDGTGEIRRIAQGQIGRVLHIAPAPDGTKAVSYTHLTLPTTPYV